MINKDRMKGFFAGILASTGTWMIVVTAQQDIIKVSPIQNFYIVGAILIFISWQVGKK